MKRVAGVTGMPGKSLGVAVGSVPTWTGTATLVWPPPAVAYAHATTEFVHGAGAATPEAELSANERQ